MSKLKKDQGENLIHTHIFGTDGKCYALLPDYLNGGQKECSCEKITWAEFDRRKAEWDKYYEDVKKTDDYKCYVLMRQALKNGQQEAIKKIRERAKRRLEENTWLKKPEFPDPELERVYNRLWVI